MTTKELKPGKIDIFSLKGKVALITGGGSGLGRVFCEALSAYGADIAIADIDPKGSQKTIKLINGSRRKTLAVKADISDPEQVQYMVSETVSNFGKIDILMNNAGISAKAAKIAEMSLEDWDRVMAVNLRGVFLCTRAVLPVMQKQKSGSIINISSVKGIRPFYEIAKLNPKAHYTVAKAGVISLTKETAMEYADAGIRVNCIAPGWYGKTKLDRWLEASRTAEYRESQKAIVERTTPMGRMGEPIELKGLVIYLASDASSFVTGQVFVADGGFCI